MDTFWQRHKGNDVITHWRELPEPPRTPKERGGGEVIGNGKYFRISNCQIKRNVWDDFKFEEDEFVFALNNGVMLSYVGHKNQNNA